MPIAPPPLPPKTIRCPECLEDLTGLIEPECITCGADVRDLVPQFEINGKLLRIRSGAELPRYCIKTGEPVEGRPHTKKLYYAPSWVAVLILINVLLCLIVYLCIRKPCMVTYYECERIVARRRRSIMINSFIAVYGFAAILTGLSIRDGQYLAISGLIALLIALIWGIIIQNRGLRVTRHDEGDFWIKGCKPAFMTAARDASA